MSWFNGGGESAATSTADGSPPPAPAANADANAAPDLTGAPEFMQDKAVQSFWTPPAEGTDPDWMGVAQKLAAAVKDGRTKIGEQGAQLARYTVPDSVAPYEEGLELETLVKAHERAGVSAEQAKQFLAQAHAAKVPPGPARDFLHAQLKSRHEAAPVVKDAATRRDEAIASLNAAGRPGSEMAKRIQGVGGRLIAEGKWTEEQAEAFADALTSPAAIEAANVVFSLAPANPASPGQSVGSATLMRELEAKLDKAIAEDDHVALATIGRQLEQHKGLVGTKYQDMVPPNAA